MGYGPSEDGEERDKFWNDMDRILDRIKNGYRWCILGDRTRGGITGSFGFPGENDNGTRVEFCAERGLCVGNIYVECRSLQKYTRVVKGQDGVEVKSMIDLVLVKDLLHHVQDEKAVRGMG